MTSTVFVQSRAGAITKMDVPTDVHALERYEKALESGALRVIPKTQVVEEETRYGGIIHVLKNSGGKPAASVPSAEADSKE